MAYPCKPSACVSKILVIVKGFSTIFSFTVLKPSDNGIGYLQCSLQAHICQVSVTLFTGYEADKSSLGE